MDLSSQVLTGGLFEYMKLEEYDNLLVRATQYIAETSLQDYLETTKLLL